MREHRRQAILEIMRDFMKITRLADFACSSSIGLLARFRTPATVSCLAVLLSCSLPPPDESRVTQRLPTDAEVEQYNAQVEPEDRIICRDETPVGTNIPQRRCYYAQEFEEVGRFHREQLRNVLR